MDKCLYCHGNCPNELLVPERRCAAFVEDVHGLYATMRHVTAILNEKLAGSLLGQQVTPELIEKAAELSREVVKASWPEWTVAVVVQLPERPDELTIQLKLTPKG